MSMSFNGSRSLIDKSGRCLISEDEWAYGMADRENTQPLSSHKPAKSEDEEFEEVEQQLEHASKTFKLTLRAIKRLDKAKSNKFVLPLKDTIEDRRKWLHLIAQPFSFLFYNGAKFSVKITRTLEQSDLLGIVDLRKQFAEYEIVKNKIEAKRKYYNEMLDRLTKVGEALEQQIVDLKLQFEEKAKEFKQPKLLKFVADRTQTNIATIRIAQKTVQARIIALKNKRLTTNPPAFFKRAVRFYLGNTGNDILKDLEKLGFTSEEDYVLLIDYLYFLIVLIEKNENKFVPPALMIADENSTGFGYKNTTLLEVVASHMFFNILKIELKDESEKDEKPKSVEWLNIKVGDKYLEVAGKEFPI